MKRQLSGLDMAQQLSFADEYKKRFGARIHLGTNAADYITLSEIPAMSTLDYDSEQALRELDLRVYQARITRDVGGCRTGRRDRVK